MTNMAMSKLDLNALSLDELWTLHERLSNILTQRMVVEKCELEQRLVQLDRGRNTATWSLEGGRQRQKYLGVAPKYQNPSSPQKLGPGAVNNRAGLFRRSRQAAELKISRFQIL
jgi:DNA-binding protein H-NS